MKPFNFLHRPIVEIIPTPPQPVVPGDWNERGLGSVSSAEDALNIEYGPGGIDVPPPPANEAGSQSDDE